MVDRVPRAWIARAVEADTAFRLVADAYERVVAAAGTVEPLASGAPGPNSPAAWGCPPRRRRPRRTRWWPDGSITVHDTDAELLAILTDTTADRVRAAHKADLEDWAREQELRDHPDLAVLDADLDRIRDHS
ncbi:hypothetical protein [Embleya sp. NBC_00896]|uniref:hypothetical protein n=1 Tax=Embleya sp. NBC_00896 TaxID=2975961 RepID=UPI002F90E3B6|nr:hypothetical protein OG928_46945 [Embleya sp. NBC_00896]